MHPERDRNNAHRRWGDGAAAHKTFKRKFVKKKKLQFTHITFAWICDGRGLRLHTRNRMPSCIQIMIIIAMTYSTGVFDAMCVTLLLFS